MKKKGIFRFRGWIQAAAALLTNIHIPNFFKGKIYTGSGKNICVPGLNCYSCPGAAGSCPIGAMQSVTADRKHSIPYYALGLVLLMGTVLGRFICGFLCPFGWFQELLYKIPPKRKLKVPEKPDKLFRYLKYLILIVFVLVLPNVITNQFGQGSPFFCKWICPAGTLEGGIPLILTNPSLKNMLGGTFWWKFALLVMTIAASWMIYRPFCKYICPLGALYALMNKISIARMKLDRKSCITCGKCVRSCPMQVDVLKDINSLECIRCGKCAEVCPTGAIDFKFGKISLAPNEKRGK